MQPVNIESALQQVSLQIAQATLSRGVTLEKTTALIRKLDLFMDSEFVKCESVNPPLACKPGCDHCCHHVVLSTVPEVLRAADYVNENFSEEQKSALMERLDTYEHIVAPHFGLNLDRARPTCPLLIEHKCSIYEARPFECRSACSYDANACLRAKEHPGERVPVPTLPPRMKIAMGLFAGYSQALGVNGLDREPYDFARGLKAALQDPDAGEDYVRGKEAFGVAQKQGSLPEHFPQNVPYRYPSYGPNQEPTGHIEPTDLAVADYYMSVVGDFDVALQNLKGPHPAHRLRRITTPSAYTDVAEIEEWRERFLQEMRDFAGSNFDPREAFDALEGFTTFNLAYQMNDVRGPLTELGQLICNQITAKALPSLTTPIEPRRRSGKLKVGYISHSLRDSNGAIWALGWLANHADDIETYAFNLFEAEDRGSLRFKEEADHYFHLRGNVPEAARFIKSLGLDVLIYPDLGMPKRNYQFASMRLAPVQCTAWGHPVTSGLPTIDHYLSSDLMEPPNGQEHYSENLVRLPNSGLCYGRPTVSASQMTKADFGLDDGPLYLMCQNIMKCHPRWDHLYRRINEETGRPIVFIEFWRPGVKKIIRERFARAGIDAKWLPTLRPFEFSRLLSLAEVSLDTPDWSGGNSTFEALSFGVPVITLPGEFMRGRHSYAFLKIAGAERLIAKDADDYVDLAINSDRRHRAMTNLNADALFDDLTPVTALDSFFRSAVAD